MQKGKLPFTNMWASRAANMSNPERTDLGDKIAYAPAPRATVDGPRAGSAWNDFYMIPTKTKNDPEGARPGWAPQRSESNKDLRFFDALFAKVQQDYKFDAKQVFVMGHSNGGGMTYLLWQMRADKITAFGPSAATGGVRLTCLSRPGMWSSYIPRIGPMLSLSSFGLLVPT